MSLSPAIQFPQGRLDEMLTSLFGGAMIPVKVRLGAAKSFPVPSQDEIQRSAEVLRQADAIARQHAPGSAPGFDEAAALWAAKVFHFALNRLVDRIEVDTDLPQNLAASEPPGDNPAAHWSTDLVFRSLWDLFKRSTAESKEDSLNSTLLQLASRWPLAAVGIPTDVDENRMPVIWNHNCLRRVYVDRVLGRSDDKKQHPPWWPQN